MNRLIYDTIRKKIIYYNENGELTDGIHKYICVLINRYDCTAIKCRRATPIIPGLCSTDHVIVCPSYNKIAPFCYYINRVTGKSAFLILRNGRVIHTQDDLYYSNITFIGGTPLMLRNGKYYATYSIYNNNCSNIHSMHVNLPGSTRILQHNMQLKYFINNAEYQSIHTALVCMRQHKKTFSQLVVAEVIKHVVNVHINSNYRIITL